MSEKEAMVNSNEETKQEQQEVVTEKKENFIKRGWKKTPNWLKIALAGGAIGTVGACTKQLILKNLSSPGELDNAPFDEAE